MSTLGWEVRWAIVPPSILTQENHHGCLCTPTRKQADAAAELASCRSDRSVRDCERDGARALGRNPAALAERAYDLASTPLADRKYLTHEELEQRHGASKEDLDKIEHFAQEHDLTVVYRSAAERPVVLKGKRAICWRRFTPMSSSTTMPAEPIGAAEAKSRCRNS
jgi:hypothetical protein